jgi:hypothetical protein
MSDQDLPVIDSSVVPVEDPPEVGGEIDKAQHTELKI